ncbi:hypothetical protein V6N13_086880 [Hibiscus sabdariffa]|uniref:Transmembrane protein n=1 Tax=Hibiscus sabdariffa TaxID=183260 RepID=A0ABR2FUJ0_9ROSI
MMEGARGFLSVISMIFFSLLLSAPKHHRLLFYPCDFVVVAKSSPLEPNIFNVSLALLLGALIKMQLVVVNGDKVISSVSTSEYVDQDGENYYNDGSDVEDVEVYHGYDSYDEENYDVLGTNDR